MISLRLPSMSFRRMWSMCDSTVRPAAYAHPLGRRERPPAPAPVAAGMMRAPNDDRSRH
jgi:hypothetical protein